MRFANEKVSSHMELMAPPVLPGVAVIVANSVAKLIDAFSGIKLFSIHTNLDDEIRQKDKKGAF